MKKNIWSAAFALTLVIDIIGVVTKNNTVQLVCKPLLLLLLIAFFYQSLRENNSGLKKWIFFALIFSWIGDVLLLFQDREEFFFLLGLSAFLLAHIFYIIFFHKVRLHEGVQSKPLTLVVVIVYYGLLIALLSPSLGSMKLPVRIYGIVISFMFMLAMHMLYIRSKKAGLWMMTGALLFVISDSALAIDKFYRPFELAGPVVMFTYGIAQWLITAGAILYLRQTSLKN